MELLVAPTGAGWIAEFDPELSSPRATWQPPGPLPEFRPLAWLRNGHLQTLAATLDQTHARSPRGARLNRVLLPDGDSIVLHDDAPANWRPGDPAVLLIHGLAGSHASPALVRTAYRLRERGCRTFRMDMRGAGAGMTVARLPYHSGRSDDCLEVLRAIESVCPQSPLFVVGFSLGGNLTLNLVGNHAHELPSQLVSAIAVSPPVDLSRCVHNIQLGVNRFYDKYFVKRLLRQIREHARLMPRAFVPRFTHEPRNLFELDNMYTAPVCGFETAEHYYAVTSPVQFLSRIEVPTLIISSLDDPMIPPEPLQNAKLSPSVRVHYTNHGGHIGFIGAKGNDPDTRWCDWRIIDWIAPQNLVRRGAHPVPSNRPAENPVEFRYGRTG